MNKIFLKLAMLPLMINRSLLHLAMLPSGLWGSMGADTGQMRAILEVRLIMDDRKPLSIGVQRQKKDRKFGTLFNTILYLVFGFMYMFPLLAVTDRILGITIYFSLLLTILTMMLITDFSNVLFDTRDKYIIFPRPVNDSTIVLARMLHVFIYLVRIVIPLALPAWILLGYLDGWRSALLFPVPLLLTVCMALFAVNCIYVILLRLVKPERFKDIMNYFQIVIFIFFVATFYFSPRYFDPERPMTLDIQQLTWVRFTPSYWLATCWSWIGLPLYLKGTGILSVLAIVVPLACVYILVKYLAPQFSRRISSIDTVDVGEYKAATSVQRVKGSRFYQQMANVFNRSDDAKAGFMISWLQTSRSRTFKMRVLPSFAIMPMYFIYTVTQNKSLGEAYRHLHEHNTYLLLLYMCSYVMINAMNYVTMSDQYKAAWIYYSSPVAVPGRLMVGALKALWVKYFLPFFIFVSAFVLYVWGTPVVIDIVLSMVNATLFSACIGRLTLQYLPFSRMEQMSQGGSKFIKSLLAMSVLAILGGGHYFALHLLWLKLILLVLASILLWLVLDSYGNTAWATVMKEAEE